MDTERIQIMIEESCFLVRDGDWITSPNKDNNDNITGVFIKDENELGGESCVHIEDIDLSKDKFYKLEPHRLNTFS